MPVKRILIVEDESVTALDLQAFLVELGHSVAGHAFTGREALELARKHRPDLALMDIRLPGDMDGIATALELRRELNIPVIFTTAFSEDETLARAREAGPYGYLLKPIEPRELRVVIEMSLARHEAETRLRERERELTTILATAQDGYAQLDGRGRFLDVNQAYCDMTGRSREELLALSLSDMSPDTPPLETAALLERWLREGGGRVERRHRHKDGRTVILDVSINALPGPEPRLVCFSRDVTERKRLEGQLRQAQKMEAVGQLAGGVAHDFNNILGATLMQLCVLRESLSIDPAVLGTLDELEDAIKRAAALTRQLLLFGRRSAMTPKVLDPNTVVAHLLKMLARLIGENIDLRFHPAAVLPYIEADTGMIEQVIMNLVVNARDAMPEGGVITLATALAEFTPADAAANPDRRPGRFVRLSVTDTGCGMDETTLRHAFEPFFTTKEAGKGTGLGLATVHGIAGQHQGWVEVQSAPGAGTEFRVFIPVTSKPPPETGEAAQSLSHTTRQETVLLVEDADFVRNALIQALQMLGYKVLEAANGPAALLLWQQHASEIALLFTDMVMPGGMNGLELARRLRQDRPALKVILSSGYSEEMTRLGAPTDAGIVLLPKPCDGAVLSRALRDCLAAP